MDKEYVEPAAEHGHRLEVTQRRRQREPKGPGAQYGQPGAVVEDDHDIEAIVEGANDGGEAERDSAALVGDYAKAEGQAHQSGGDPGKPLKKTVFCFFCRFLTGAGNRQVGLSYQEQGRPRPLRVEVRKEVFLILLPRHKTRFGPRRLVHFERDCSGAGWLALAAELMPLSSYHQTLPAIHLAGSDRLT